jgi:hypothetical protein
MTTLSPITTTFGRRNINTNPVSMKYFLKCAVNNKAGGGETANGIESGKRADGENEEDKTN